MIFALNAGKVYVPNERNKRATLYDDYFVIFGNS